MVGAVMGGIVCGLDSSRIGRRRTIAMALVGAIAVIPAWAFAPSLAVLVAGTFLMQAFVQGAWGVIPAHITELSPDSVRGFLPGFAYQCGAALAGAIPYLEARLAERLNYGRAMAPVAATGCALGVRGPALRPQPPGVALRRPGLSPAAGP